MNCTQRRRLKSRMGRRVVSIWYGRPPGQPKCCRGAYWSHRWRIHSYRGTQRTCQVEQWVPLFADLQDINPSSSTSSPDAAKRSLRISAWKATRSAVLQGKMLSSPKPGTLCYQSRVVFSNADAEHVISQPLNHLLYARSGISGRYCARCGPIAPAGYARGRELLNRNQQATVTRWYQHVKQQ